MTRAPAFAVLALGLAAPAFAETARPVQGMGESPLTATALLETAGGLVLVVVLILGLAWLVRRTGHMPGAGKGLVRVLGGVSLGPRERAVVIAVDDVRLLVGVAPGRVQTLHVLTGEAGSASRQEDEDSFDRALEQARQAGGDD